MPGPDTKTRILTAAAELMQRGGPVAVTFDAIAARIGLTKQAVLYWYPNKTALMTAIALPMLRDEAATAIRAARSARDPAEARRAVVLALTRFHLADIGRFRMLYVAPQIGADPQAIGRMVAAIHPITDRMYGAIARALGDGVEARHQAVALHMAALGHALLTGVTNAAEDPMKHSAEALAEALAALVSATG